MYYLMWVCLGSIFLKVSVKMNSQFISIRRFQKLKYSQRHVKFLRWVFFLKIFWLSDYNTNWFQICIFSNMVKFQMLEKWSIKSKLDWLIKWSQNPKKNWKLIWTFIGINFFFYLTEISAYLAARLWNWHLHSKDELCIIFFSAKMIRRAFIGKT